MMDDESRENLSGDAGEEDKRTAWQRNKEALYDKVPGGVGHPIEIA